METQLIDAPEKISQKRLKELTKAGRAAWDERYGDLIAGKQNWQRAAFCSFGIAALSIMGMIHAAGLPKQVVVPFEVDNAGHVLNVFDQKDEPLTPKLWQEIYKTQLTNFVNDWRTVTSDKSAQDAMWDRAYLKYVASSSPAYATLTSWYQTNNPETRAEKGSVVTVTVNTVDRPGDTTMGLWWTEREVSQSGEFRSDKKYHGVFTFVKAKNGIGIKITEIRVGEVNQ